MHEFKHIYVSKGNSSILPTSSIPKEVQISARKDPPWPVIYSMGERKSM